MIKPIPITVFTGFLGAGKTTIILELIKKLPDLKISLLKNEFGDSKVDSKLLDSHIKVTEISNGCLCCVLVGQMKNALLELKLQSPDRIIIETSGSAFPAPIAWQIRELGTDFELDSIITVIDCVNFKGYEDTSYTAKMQAQYTDLILLNKYELVTERDLDIVVDSINDLNTDTPKIKWQKDMNIGLFFGFDTKLFELNDKSIFKSDHHENEVDLITIESGSIIDINSFELLLKRLPKEDVYRVKGLFLPNKILNWAFGRWTWSDYDSDFKSTVLTVMGVGLFRYKKLFIEFFEIDAKLNFHQAHLE